jgi:hypothetical protein
MLMGKPLGKHPLGKPRRRWEDNIKMNLKETMVSGWDWLRIVRMSDFGKLLLALNLRVSELQ